MSCGGCGCKSGVQRLSLYGTWSESSTGDKGKEFAIPDGYRVVSAVMSPEEAGVNRDDTTEHGVYYSPGVVIFFWTQNVANRVMTFNVILERTEETDLSLPMKQFDVSWV